MRRHISLRLPEAALEVVDAWAAHLSHIRSTPASRADAIEYLAGAVKPPQASGPTESAIRVAHKALEATKQL